MNGADCDFSPMKQKVAEHIQQLIHELQQNLNILENEDYCVLGNLEGIKKNLLYIESMAASFYLNCYLSAFTDTYKDLSICVQHLSKQHHGALIVVERLNPLDAIIQKGTIVGATVTSTLLESIFYPGNPLHDGAVLIRGNKIVSAGNVLPLTTKDVGERKLGTRHRAALGVTEQSDALALVVSEETQKISFALNGKLYPVITTQSLH
ncbi:sporulation-specific diadenylate cyclase CdaS [Ectobacillus funiculus]|uniref:sporulation-specific diadenylate cyclase CdaS n=1 Tax=Ectobacillus funiculus TaxID=137993 RepID=UPI00101D5E2F|nr:sporulation-specific diadenylate cyclase CdaS [Ectobacillus funiculus]